MTREAQAPWAAALAGVSIRPERMLHDAVAALRQRRVVRHQHQRGAALDVAGEQQIDHLPAGGLVKIAGRLVGHQDGRIGRQRPGERDALLLAAGQLRRIMVEPRAKSDRWPAPAWRA